MGLRIQIAVGATVVLGGLLAGLLAFSDSKVRLAGTNSVGAKDRVAELEAGQRLCVRDLRLPAGARAVSLVLSARGGGPARVRLTLFAPARTVRSSATVSTRGEAVFPLPAGLRPGPARVCLRPEGALDQVLGTPSRPFVGVNYEPGLADLPWRPNATIGSYPLPSLVAVRFREDRATTRLSRLDDAARRASVFRPGWVRPWTYALLLVAIPLLWVAGLALVWRVGR
jgi:hypothetical protein